MNKKNIILDLDGTLYYLFFVKLIMCFELLMYYLLHFWKFKELAIIYYYRKIREENSENIVKKQYTLVAKKYNIPINRVKNLIEKWILIKPLKVLALCKDRKLDNLIIQFKKNGGKVIIYSDYPTKKKLELLNTLYDIAYDATNPKINVLKPNTKGLMYIIKENKLKREETIFVGDRDSKDGACARKCNVEYVILPNFFRKRKIAKISEIIGGNFNE